MGGSHSRSEDLRKRTFMSSDNYIGSLQEVPGYFTKTQETVDFLEEDLSTSPRIEMSYTGPPSHLRHSRDVHPFLDRFGPDFEPKERFVDLSQNADIPPSLLPSVQSARELREIEVGETLASLKEQVKETLAKKREQALEGVAQSPEESFNTDTPTEEQTTLAFFDSIINESMGINFGVDDDDDDDDEAKSESSSDTNWMLRDKTKLKLPGLMHSTVPVVGGDHPDAPTQPNSRPASGFFRNSMYLPDTDPIHVASRSNRLPPPIKPKPANRRSWVVPSSDGVTLRNPNHSQSPRPLSLPVQPSHSYKILEVEESKNSSNSSTEDMGIVDDITSDEGSRNGDHFYDTNSRVKGVQALVSMYSEAATSPTKSQEDFTSLSPKSSFNSMQLPVRDYVFGNYNNSNVGRLGSPTRVGADKFQTYGTISSEDSALGVSSGDLAEDSVLGVIQAELQKLRVK